MYPCSIKTREISLKISLDPRDFPQASPSGNLSGLRKSLGRRGWISQYPPRRGGARIQSNFQGKIHCGANITVLLSVAFPIQAICQAIQHSQTHFELLSIDENFQFELRTFWWKLSIFDNENQFKLVFSHLWHINFDSKWKISNNKFWFPEALIKTSGRVTNQYSAPWDALHCTLYDHFVKILAKSDKINAEGQICETFFVSSIPLLSVFKIDPPKLIIWFVLKEFFRDDHKRYVGTDFVWQRTQLIKTFPCIWLNINK